MGKVYECTFNTINGENTGVFTRTKMTKNSPSPGVLVKKNCPDELHFYCDPNDGGTNNYYRLLNPEKYKGIKTNMGPVYVPLYTQYLVGWKLVDDPNEVKQPTPPPVVRPAAPPTIPIKPKSLKNPNDTNVKLQNAVNGNILNPSSVSLNEDISTYVSYTGKTDNALTPKRNWNEYGPNRISDNYFMNYTSLMNDINIIEKNLNIAISAEASRTLQNDMLNKFNRFLIAYPNSALSKTFGHVFFTRPELNLYQNNNIALLEKVSNDPYFYYMNKNNPELLKSLTKNFSNEHDFNPFLSNKAGSFDLKDEYIDTAEYGETFTGWKIKYGKHNIKSKTADSFSITYTDDNNYNIYKIHKAWVDYISKVYRGEFEPNRDNIRSRTIDYAASVYYFLCGPDGETILFWSKYTGVFPTTIPSSASAWTKGNIVKMPEFSINYEFSWKEDMMPTTLAEFNLNALRKDLTTISRYETNADGKRVLRLNNVDDDSIAYAKTYEPELGSTGRAFVNQPFVETIVNGNSYYYKLRFKP